MGGAVPSGGIGAAPTGGTGGTGAAPTSGTGGIGGGPTGGTGGTGAAPTGGTGGTGAEPTGGASGSGGGSTGGTSGSGGGSTGGASGSGGESTGGASGGTPPVDQPELVTSGQNAYWQEGQLTEQPSGDPEIRIDENTTYQEWDGFGGTFNEAGWDALMELDPSERERAMKLLFDATIGARFAFGRLPIGASDYAMDRYTLCEQANDYEMTSFSIARDRERLIPYIQAALVVKPDVRLWASPWTPPAWMKDNNSTDAGNMKSDPQILQAHALYLAMFVEAYHDEGLEIEMIMPQNEPGYGPDYPSCLWTPQLLQDFIGNYLGPTFAQRNVPAEIWLGTMSAPEDAQHVQTVLNDPTAKGFVKGIGLQWNLLDSVGSYSSQYHLPVMQTEHKCGNYHWLDGFNPNFPPNDHAYAEESWGLMRDWIKAGVTSYSAWNMVLDTVGKNLNSSKPWPQNALLTVNRDTNALTETPTYYVFRHFSYFVDPGAVRVGTTGSFSEALAFKNPDGSIVTVLYNSGGSARQTTLGVGTTSLQFSVPAHGWATVNWEGA
ncbi:MAG: glucosylceramidase [Polyangiaceae bacterium]|nr:glucosylceramidase [Polyangiaceae bacterium]